MRRTEDRREGEVDRFDIGGSSPFDGAVGISIEVKGGVRESSIENVLLSITISFDTNASSPWGIGCVDATGE